MQKIIDVNQASLKKIAPALLNYADEFSFVVREGIQMDETAVVLIKGMEQFLVNVQRLSKWPGTTLLWDYAVLYTYRLNDLTADALCKFEDDLYSWLHPRMPEDLIFYKEKKAIFVSVTHEKEAYMNINNEEQTYFRIVGLI